MVFKVGRHMGTFLSPGDIFAEVYEDGSLHIWIEFDNPNKKDKPGMVLSPKEWDGLVAWTEQNRVKQIGGKRNMFMRLARWFEWAFGTALMTTITVIVSSQYLSGFATWALLIGLLIFLVATFVKRFDDAGWFAKSK